MKRAAQIPATFILSFTGTIFTFHKKKTMKTPAKKAAAKKAAASKTATKKASAKKDTAKGNPDDDKAYKDFKSLVNMTAASLEKWLTTEESKQTGQESGDGEMIGHKSGEGIVKILHKKKGELTEEDYTLMHRTISFISRHKAQKPSGDLSETPWNYSLKNWGYDYSKDN